MGSCVQEVLREWFLSGKKDLERADDPDFIVIMDFLTVGRVDFHKFRSQAFQALFLSFLLQSLSKLGVALSPREETIKESFQVEACSPHDERDFLSFQYAFYRFEGLVDEIRSRVLSGEVDDIKQMMRDTLSLFQRSFVCSDVKSFVDLHGVAVDDFPLQFLGEPHSDGAFPHPCRTQDNDQVLGFRMQFLPEEEQKEA